MLRTKVDAAGVGRVYVGRGRGLGLLGRLERGRFHRLGHPFPVDERGPIRRPSSSHDDPGSSPGFPNVMTSTSSKAETSSGTGPSRSRAPSASPAFPGGRRRGTPPMSGPEDQLRATQAVPIPDPHEERPEFVGGPGGLDRLDLDDLRDRLPGPRPGVPAGGMGSITGRPVRAKGRIARFSSAAPRPNADPAALWALAIIASAIGWSVSRRTRRASIAESDILWARATTRPANSSRLRNSPFVIVDMIFLASKCPGYRAKGIRRFSFRAPIRSGACGRFCRRPG